MKGSGESASQSVTMSNASPPVLAFSPSGEAGRVTSSPTSESLFSAIEVAHCCEVNKADWEQGFCILHL